MERRATTCERKSTQMFGGEKMRQKRFKKAMENDEIREREIPIFLPSGNLWKRECEIVNEKKR